MQAWKPKNMNAYWKAKKTWSEFFACFKAQKYERRKAPKGEFNSLQSKKAQKT